MKHVIRLYPGEIGDIEAGAGPSSVLTPLPSGPSGDLPLRSEQFMN